MEDRPPNECLGIENADLNRYLSRASATNTPLSASFELTRRCNFRCVHCYLGDQQALQQHRQQELDTDTIIKLLDQMVEAGTLFLTLTGGDPMLRPDFIRIYEHAVRSGLLVSVYCNGSLITEKIAASFTTYPPRIVEITLYGATQKTFETITQRPGSYTACIQGISLLRQAGVRLRLKTMAITLNYQELPAMRSMAKEMGLQFRHDCSIIPALPNEDNSGRTNSSNDIRCTDVKENFLQETLRFRLSPEQAALIDVGADDVKKILHELTRQHDDFTKLSEKSSRKIYHCGAGRVSYHITPYGKIQPCIITLQPSVDCVAGSQDFVLCWKKLHEEFAQQKATKDFACNTCEDNRLCTGCPSGFVLEKGSPEDVPSFYCKYAACRRKQSSDS
ncbi:MAG: radical SAM protein [Candidatus Electrothrix sp. AW3_4]|nr:radical SAM protein [Candidatus Electrothrix gigas]